MGLSSIVPTLPLTTLVIRLSTHPLVDVFCVVQYAHYLLSVNVFISPTPCSLKVAMCPVFSVPAIPLIALYLLLNNTLSLSLFSILKYSQHTNNLSIHSLFLGGGNNSLLP